MISNFLPSASAFLILKKWSLWVVLVLTVLSSNAFFAMAQLPVGFAQTPLAEGLDPIRMAIADDGRIFIAEKNGTIKIVKNELLLPDPLISIPVDNFSERGLAGFVLDPDFGTNQFFYVYYTVPGESHNRVSRFKASGDYADLNTEEVLLNLDPLKGYYHNAGAMVFMPDGKLYISTGDGGNSFQAQSLNSLLGKILRINPDGSIPEDNPFFDVTTGYHRSIYALGLRNPFCMAFDPSSGMTLINDVGGSLFEEINLLEPGKNYGWPLVEGAYDAASQTELPENYKDPLYSYDRTGGCAIVGAAFYSPSVYTFPEMYHNKFLFGDYCGDYIKVMDPETGEVLETFVSYVYRPVAFMTAPDGTFYYFSRGGMGGSTDETHTTSHNGVLWKVVYTGDGKPAVFKHPESQLLSVGEDCVFEISATGAKPLRYQWQRNGVDIKDSTSSTLSIKSVTLLDHGSKFSCKVSNDEGEIESEEGVLSVTANKRPVITFLSPREDLMYTAGDTIVFEGRGDDEEDGTIPNERLLWRVDFHHDEHAHPVIESLAGVDSSAFIVPLYGETSPHVWYRIHITATDENGLSQTTYKDVYPKTSKITLLTDPAHLKVHLDGQPIATPSTFESVVNLSRTFNAPEVQKGRNFLYIFQKWTGDIAENHVAIETPAKDSVFTARYFAIPLNDGLGLTGKYFNQDTSFTPPPDHIRIDTTINFNWNIESPVPSAIGLNHFGVQWSGFLTVPHEDVYNFTLASDDGSRLWIDDELVIDNWPANEEEKSGSLQLLPEKKYRIKVEYFDKDAIAAVKLFWSSSLIPKSIIPRNQFSLNTPPEVTFLENYAEYKLAGDEITINGSGRDAEDGDLAALQWKINLHDGDHVHLVAEATGSDSITFSPHLDGHTGVDLWWRIYVTAEDLNGETTIDSVDIYPQIVNVTVKSNVETLPFIWGGNVFQMPDTIPTVSGATYSITVADEYVIEGKHLSFLSWNNNVFENALTFKAPMADTTLMAHYEIITGSAEPLPEVSIYPNPVTNFLTVEYHGWPVTYEIVTALGQEVIDKGDLVDTLMIDFRNRRSGIYFLKIIMGNRFRFVKILKR